MIKTFKFNVLGDDRGSLVSLEELGNIPFEIKRVYYIFDTKSQISRGFHAHKKLEQMAICVKGSCRIVLDDGQSRESVVLDSPEQGLYIDNNKWREMHDFSKDCVLLVLASNIYDESDYIRDYEEFLRLVN
ncbi:MULTISPECIES: FdtA/QdtA family cupin domain-containing protein [Vibrio]|uniref:WxcM-like domain-containing protein n=1 Tax=Vibrio tasmaniensis TaxID=212663 RepID=A0A2N7NMA8_9VIBR|nr:MULTISPECIES: FdtA/QdtA family cupin domain-containing protein [Vibrio]EAQ53103.1 WblP protein [Vibrio sp. MED222]PMP16976.1 dTDP-6-deoxy-3,4-keto-hexulose isomerase [Vibrio tasmaniensis]TKG28697.1 WxcM-like domain-containing protein [Vibrio tasmaniensis]TKG39491.1 WxcM-like domain-containing protein [Vibrio tasmaniensis]TKG43401.1 WxcM-like domain-containing protein [Vibrio tasmaniensis]